MDKNEDKGPQRYLAYANRFRFLANLKRYLAYTSDLGEAFRPIAHPYAVTITYAISWSYVAFDSHFQAKKGKEVNYYRNLAKQLVFQGIASMLLPAISIHSTVKYSAKLLESKPDLLKGLGKKRGYLPVALGLMLIPSFPLIFDHPVEKVVFMAFDKLLPEKE